MRAKNRKNATTPLRVKLQGLRIYRNCFSMTSVIATHKKNILIQKGLKQSQGREINKAPKYIEGPYNGRTEIKVISFYYNYFEKRF